MEHDTMTFGHGQGGGKEEAAAFAAVAVPHGWQVVGIDLPAHGGRRDGARLLPWVAVPELRAVSAALHARWRTVRLRANSIGAWLSMLALGDAAIEKALFVSPVVDMAALIGRMMQWAGVTEAELAARGEIPTDFGETLSWDYLRWVRAHPPVWTTPTEILYAGRDHLVPRGAGRLLRRRGPGADRLPGRRALVPHAGAAPRPAGLGGGASVSPLPHPPYLIISNVGKEHIP